MIEAVPIPGLILIKVVHKILPKPRFQYMVFSASRKGGVSHEKALEI
jgi:hypothetical protein